MGETSGQYDRVETRQRPGAVPHQLGRHAQAGEGPTASCSQLVPGKTHDPDRVVPSSQDTSAGRDGHHRLRSVHRGWPDSRVLDDGVGQQARTQCLALGVAWRPPHEAERLAGPHPLTPSRPSAGSARSMVAPCGSAIPGRSSTSTKAAKTARTAPRLTGAMLRHRTSRGQRPSAVTRVVRRPPHSEYG